MVKSLRAVSLLQARSVRPNPSFNPDPLRQAL